MSLPKVSIPTYTTTLPISKQEIKFRPFLVKEEKTIMIAFNDPSENTLYETIKVVLSDCTYNAVNVETLTLVDIEYLFLQLRIKSKGSFSEVVFQCNNEKPDGSVCLCPNEIQIDLEKVFVEQNQSNTNNIILDENDKLGVVLKYPTLQSLKTLEQLANNKDVDRIYRIFTKFIDTIYKQDELFDASNFSEDELVDWLESLTNKQIEKIKDFFKNLPKLKYKQLVKCPSCGHEEEVVLEGLRSFLD